MGLRGAGLVPARQRQLTALVERFNGRISDLVNLLRFLSAVETDNAQRHRSTIYQPPHAQRALVCQSNVRAIALVVEW